jgi:acetyltransferase-like isoleucine patch superfamily enzyme
MSGGETTRSDGVGSIRRTGLPAGLTSLGRAALRYLAVKENVAVGDGLRAGRGVVLSSPHGLKIGNWVAIGPHTTIQVDGEIGDFCLIGMSVQIAGRRDHALDEIGTPIYLATWVGDRAKEPGDEVHIGVDVWIGGHATILSGVRIGDGAVVGAGSVVTHDVQPFEIVAGVPARPVGMRFVSESERSRHLERLVELSGEMSSAHHRRR